MINLKFKIQNVLLLTFLLLIFHNSQIEVCAQFAVKAETIWTMAGEPINNGVVLIKNGKIEAVGSAANIQIPNNYQVVSAKILTPGLIDAHTVVGLNGYLNQPHDQMALDGSASMQPELRAIDSYNPEERLVEWIRGFGVTTIHTGHQPSALISGQTMIVKTFGKTADDATIIPTSMVSVTLGNDGLAGQGRSPGTRAKATAMLRAELLKAQENAKKSDSPKDLKSEIMIRIIKGEVKLLITAHKANDIMTALRIAKEFNLKIILDGVSEASLLLNEIKASGFPVIIHPTMARPGGDTESLSVETASKLKSAGILFALQSGFEGYVPKSRVLLFEASMTAGNGLSQRDTLAAITIDAAKILGIDNRIGSIAVGKDADLALFDGDPFEWTSHCIGTFINGNLVSKDTR